MTEQKRLISVIVPVYNLAQYLSKCIDSILCQTYENFELILVDDGSKDDSGIICDEYAEKDMRVRVIHQANQGVGASRNHGIEITKGEYVVFIDGDDYVSKDYLQVLYDDILKNGADIACSNYAIVENGQVNDTEMPLQECKLMHTKEELFEDFYEALQSKKWGYLTSVWAKIFRRDILLTSKFGELKYGEDTLYMFEILSRNPRVSFITYYGYYYVIREGSAMTQAGIEKEIERARQQMLAYKYPVYEVPLKPETKKQASITLAVIIQNIIELTVNSKQKALYKKYKSELVGEINRLLEYCNPYEWVRRRQTVNFWLYKKCPYWIYCLIVRGWRLLKK